MKYKQILIAILILAFILRVVLASIIPIFEKPDEVAHFEYIKFVSENKKLPVQTEKQRGAELFQPPLYYIIVSFILSFVKSLTDNLTYQVYMLRFISIFISILTLYLVYKITLLIFNNQTLGLGAVAFASFLPSHINMNSNITNSNLGDFLSTLIIYLVLLILIKGENLKRIFALGLVVGLSLITRWSIIPAIITVPFAFVIKDYPNIKKIIKPLALIVFIALIISGWHFVRNFILYGDLLGINALKLHVSQDTIKIDLIFIARFIGWTFITIWAAFGRTNGVFIGNLTSVTGIMIFILSYLLLLIFSLSSIYGLYLLLKQYRRNKKILRDKQKKSFTILAFHLIILSLFFISLNLYDFQPQGRLFFPTIANISVIFTVGIYKLFKKKSKFLSNYLFLFILINLASIISIISHYY